MSQQVNLFRYVIKPVKPFLELNTFFSVIGIIFAVLMLFTCIEWFQVHRIQNSVDALSKLSDQDRTNMVNIAKAYPENSFSASIINSNNTASCKVKFSNYLTSMAEASVPGLWLTDFKISDNGNQIALHGHGYNANAVQLYLNHLKNAKLFADLNFTLDNITEEQPNTTTLVNASNANQPKEHPFKLSFSITAKRNTHG